MKGGVTSGLVAGVAALPWLREVPGVPGPVARTIDLTFLPLCHHWTGRVLSFGGHAMCVCSRCAGLYAGLALGFLVGGPNLGDRAYRRGVVVAAALLILDVVTQDLGFHEPLHPVRLATGALLGWVVAAWMTHALSPYLAATLSWARAERPASRSASRASEA